jgi:predicted nucleic acid-binding protein
MSTRKLRLPLHYWDTCNFLTILKGDKNNLEGCLDILNEAKSGRLKIVTSSLTLAAIVKLEPTQKPALLKSDESRIIETFFLHDYFIFRDLDRKTAEMARHISWELGVKSFDAIHVATAVRAKVDFFETSDKSLIKKIEGQIGDPLIIVRQPFLPEKQLDLISMGEAISTEEIE